MGKYDLIFFFPAVLLSFRGSGATARIFFTVILSVAKYPTEERTAFMGFFTFVRNDKGDSYGTAMPRLRMTETAGQKTGRLPFVIQREHGDRRNPTGRCTDFVQGILSLRSE